MKNLIYIFCLIITACGEHKSPNNFSMFWSENGPTTRDKQGNACRIGHEGKLLSESLGVLRVGCFGNNQSITEVRSQSQIVITPEKAKELQVAMKKIDFESLRTEYKSDHSYPDATVLQLIFNSGDVTKEVDYPSVGKVKAPSNLKSFLNILNDLEFFVGTGWSSE